MKILAKNRMMVLKKDLMKKQTIALTMNLPKDQTKTKENNKKGAAITNSSFSIYGSFSSGKEQVLQKFSFLFDLLIPVGNDQVVLLFRAFVGGFKEIDIGNIDAGRIG